MEQGLFTINDAISRNAPGIDIREVPGAFNTDLGARGFRNNDSITRQYDGLAMGLVSSCTTFPFDSWTAERVEALHGPASVLYGHGAIGGAINVVPKVPLEKFQTEMLFSYGTDDTVRIGAGNTGPVTENLFYRADVSFNQSDGWQEDGDRRNLSARVSLRWDATDDLSFILAHDHKILTVAHVRENEFSGRSERDLVSDLIRRAGGIPLDKSPGRQSIEKLMLLNPDALLIIDRLDTTFEQKKSAILSHPSLARIEAVKNNRFVSISYVEFYGGVIESVQTCERIAAALYPHLFDGQDEKP